MVTSACCNFLMYFVTSGYVLDCFPSTSEGWKSYSGQLHYLRGLEMKPDYVINLKVCSSDVSMIIAHSKLSANPSSGKGYT